MHLVRSIISNLRKTQTKIVSLHRISYEKPIKFHYYSTSRTLDDTDQIICEICQEDPEKEKMLKILMLEVEVMRQDGRAAPSSLQTRHWKYLMGLNSRNQRINYLGYLFKSEKSRENEKAKKEARRIEREKCNPEETKEYPDDLLYGIQHQSLFLRIRDQSINMFDNYRTLRAMTYGQKMVVDCSYENDMVHKEIMNAAKQLTFVFGDNRLHRDPFDLHICNVNMEGPFMQQMELNIPSLKEPWFPLHLHEKSYLDLFPKEKLVYLTPHCREELTTFDHDAIYIIGCMVDKTHNEPLSLAKAKKNGLKMAKLPLDRYLEWGPGSKKNLNINHMVPILLDLKETGNWEYSLRHIPRRKLMETQILAMQRKLKNPSLRQEVLRSYQNLNFKDKISKSKRSLYYDDEKL